MPKYGQSQSCEDSQPQNNAFEDHVRQDYNIQMSHNQKVVVPNVLEGLDLPLSMISVPDYSKSLKMDGGVAFYLFAALLFSYKFPSSPSSSPNYYLPRLGW